MISLRRATARFLSSSPSASLSINSRSLHSFRIPLARFPTQEKPVYFLQRRFASEEAVPKSDAEVEAERRQETPNENQASTSSDTPEPRVEPESFVTSASETLSNAAQSAAETASSAAKTVSDAASAVVGTAQESMNENDRLRALSKSIYVGNLFFDVTSEDLQKEFEKVGPVMGAKVIMNSQGSSKGFAYIDFENTEAANKAVELYDQSVFAGRRLNVQKAHRRPFKEPVDRRLNEPTKTVFLGNLPFNLTDRDLNALFRDIKDVIDVRVAVDRRTGQPRGFAHAEFTDVESAKRAYKALEGMTLLGRRIRIDYSTSSGRAVMREGEPLAGPTGQSSLLE